MKRRVTMQDVARKAGVSAGTVCRALNSNPQIPVETRERIQKIAEAMGYRPDPLISAFASRLRTKSKTSDITTIAYLTNFRTPDAWRKNRYYQGLHEGFCERAEQLGYKVEHFWLKEPGMNSRRLSQILYSRGISALCIAPLPQVRGHLSLEWERFSCVTVGYSLLRPNLHRTTVHHFHSIQTTVRELRRLGYRRIGFCLFNDTNRRVDGLWLSGILLCQTSFPDLQLEYFLFNDDSLKEVRSWIRKNKLEIVVGAGDETLLRELKDTGLAGRIDYATLAWNRHNPEIAGIDQRPEDIASAAVDLVVGQLQRGERGIPRNPITLMIEGCWMQGNTLRRIGLAAGRK